MAQQDLSRSIKQQRGTRWVGAPLEIRVIRVDVCRKRALFFSLDSGGHRGFG